MRNSVPLREKDELTIDEVVKLTRQSKKTVFRWLRNGLHSSKKTYIKKDDLMLFLWVKNREEKQEKKRRVKK